MADTIYYRFVVKQDLAANFVSKNTLLLSGEFGMETDDPDNLRLKLGNGITPWNTLPYFESGGGGGSKVLFVSGDFMLRGATHSGRLLLHSGGAITLPETVAAGFVVNDTVEVRRNGGTAVTFVAASGFVTIDYNTTLYSAAINNAKDVVALRVIAVNTWAIFGPLANA